MVQLHTFSIHWQCMYIVTRISSTSALWMSVTPIQLRVNVQSLYNFIVWSKRHSVFESLRERNSDFSGKSTTLKRFSDTTSVTDFHFLFPCILMQRVLMQCNVLCKALQSSTLHYATVKNLPRSLLYTHEVYTIASLSSMCYSMQPYTQAFHVAL